MKVGCRHEAYSCLGSQELSSDSVTHTCGAAGDANPNNTDKTITCMHTTRIDYLVHTIHKRNDVKQKYGSNTKFSHRECNK